MTNFGDQVFQFGGTPVGSIETLGMGHVYYVMQTANPNYVEFAANRTKQYNDDGSDLLHTTIQSALNATKTERNDYVIVMPDNDDYNVTAAVTMSKRNVHLLAPGGLGAAVGASNAVRFDQETADTAHLTLTGDSCEIAGLWFKATGASTHLSTTGRICVPTASTGQVANIHHNYFFMNLSGADNAPAINYYNGGSGNYSNIHHNRFQYMTPSTTSTYGCYISSANSNFEYNSMLVQNGCTVTNGVRMNGAGGSISYNSFYASIAGGGLSAGAFGAAILMTGNDTTACVGNRGAVGTGTLINGGTADTSWCDNRSAVNGGVLCVDQDIDA